ncbi:MAG: queuosine precursor transporter [Anaerolineaceae bacterium]|nr:queuosine precursor transporter [Anaerolineaceae bacterium]
MLSRAILVAVSYVAAQIFADIGSLRILFLAGQSVDGGTLIYPFTFTLRDMLHKAAGVATTRLVIFLAALINLFMALYFTLIAELPADAVVGSQEEFGSVLGPVWRIVFASIIAELIAELLDTEVYRLWVARMGDRWQWGRVLSSNALAIPLDSALFVLIAFLGDLPLPVLFSIFIANVVIKGAVTLISIPGIYLIREESALP